MRCIVMKFISITVLCSLRRLHLILSSTLHTHWPHMLHVLHSTWVNIVMQHDAQSKHYFPQASQANLLML